MQQNIDKKKCNKFIRVLYKILQNPQSYLKWSQDGSYFTIVSITSFIRQNLPAYFKHSNLSSFIRQLNIYGFKKLVSKDERVNTGYPQNSYCHQFFQKGETDQLKKIIRHQKRKIKRSSQSQSEKSFSNKSNEKFAAVKKQDLYSSNSSEEMKQKKHQMIERKKYQSQKSMQSLQKSKKIKRQIKQQFKDNQLRLQTKKNLKAKLNIFQSELQNVKAQNIKLKGQNLSLKIAVNNIQIQTPMVKQKSSFSGSDQNKHKLMTNVTNNYILSNNSFPPLFQKKTGEWPFFNLQTLNNKVTINSTNENLFNQKSNSNSYNSYRREDKPNSFSSLSKS